MKRNSRNLTQQTQTHTRGHRMPLYNRFTTYVRGKLSLIYRKWSAERVAAAATWVVLICSTFFVGYILGYRHQDGTYTVALDRMQQQGMVVYEPAWVTDQWVWTTDLLEAVLVIATITVLASVVFGLIRDSDYYD